MDQMEVTKIIGALCSALLIFLVIAWGSEETYRVGGGHGGDHSASYVIEVEETDVAEEVDEGPDLETLLASADIAKGEKVFAKCRSCHKLDDGANGVGPHLFDVVDRGIGAVDGFGYSGSMAEFGGEWTTAQLDGFLENPKGYMSGTKMSFAGLKKATDRANLIAYLDTIGN